MLLIFCQSRQNRPRKWLPSMFRQNHYCRIFISIFNFPYIELRKKIPGNVFIITSLKHIKLQHYQSFAEVNMVKFLTLHCGSFKYFLKAIKPSELLLVYMAGIRCFWMARITLNYQSNIPKSMLNSTCTQNFAKN